MSRRLIKVPAKVVIDTGPLLLFLAGNYDPESIPKMKRLKYDGKPCNAVHYDILKQYLNHAKDRLITPGILSEAWNLIDNDISNRKDKEDLFYSNLNYYIGSAEGHEYPNLQVGDEVNPRRFLR